MPLPSKHKPSNQHEPLSHDNLRVVRGHRLSNLIRSRSKIPEAAGVYIWRYWPSIASLDTDEFEAALVSWTSMQPAFTETLNGPRVNAEITRRPFGNTAGGSSLLGIERNSNKGQRFLNKMSESHESRETLFNLLECIISSIPPLYIGKADNLRKRLCNHFDGSGSNVLEMIKAQGLNADDVYVSFFLDPLSTSHDSSITTVLEEIAQRLTNPTFTKRIG